MRSFHFNPAKFHRKQAKSKYSLQYTGRKFCRNQTKKFLKIHFVRRIACGFWRTIQKVPIIPSENSFKINWKRREQKYLRFKVSRAQSYILMYECLNELGAATPKNVYNSRPPEHEYVIFINGYIRFLWFTLPGIIHVWFWRNLVG